MFENDTITNQLHHRSIRAFKDQTLDKDQLETLYQVASHTSSSMFLQQFSIIHVTDENLREKIREICHQPYVGANGDLFIFVADLYRNQQIRAHEGNDAGRLKNTDVYFQATQDTILAVQNFLNAAESMGLGGVVLGSINNDPKALIKVLDLPKMTMPILGLQIGVPDQEPQLKPRLPLGLRVFENHYNHDVDFDKLAEYDKEVETYYDLRDTNKRIDSFSMQINGKKLNNHESTRDEISDAIKEQGLAQDF
ncbi:MAG: NADPH-dependent oxidoreductase [Limosilactobacillus sp.]|uniref:NADPH-dependent oxidoreductase n=1 Tax=Limosilactobacillus sp. TaxID=2773925 RepID=UPI00270887A5|nr:NADPH-dependent oxidoreductase [Limosilactobacillus sp.]